MAAKIVTENSYSSSLERSPHNTETDLAPGKLFVGGLSWQTSSEKLREYFGMFGNVTDVLIMKDPITQRSRGFCFITFAEPISVENVLKVPIHTLDGKKVDPKYATPKNRSKSSKTKKIFVGGVGQDTSADEVKVYFTQFGKVDEAVMIMDQETKRHRGFGFITFENDEAVDRVCEIHYHAIKNKQVECKIAQPKEVVTPSGTTQFLQKRLMLGRLGVRIPVPSSQSLFGPGAGSVASNQLAVVQAQGQALQAQNVAASYGNILTEYQPTALHRFRYAPYPMATGIASSGHSAASVLSQQQQKPLQHAMAGQLPPQHVTAGGNPYPSYSIANVDMSSFQGVDWASMYGMGMYY